MSNHQKIMQEKRLRKMRGVRQRVRGTAAQPRLAIFRSSKFIYAQAIDDDRGHTLAAASEIEADLRTACADGTKIDAAKVVGKLVAERLLAKGLARVVFDRRWYRYHGRVKALADAARAGGLKF
jgi:large subunit ribosomal protein L18